MHVKVRDPSDGRLNQLRLLLRERDLTENFSRSLSALSEMNTEASSSELSTVGLFSLTLEDQIAFFESGATVTIRNAHAKVVDSHMRLEVDKWGKIEKG